MAKTDSFPLLPAVVALASSKKQPRKMSLFETATQVPAVLSYTLALASYLLTFYVAYVGDACIILNNSFHLALFAFLTRLPTGWRVIATACA